jgi:hypothetical protein
MTGPARRRAGNDMDDLDDFDDPAAPTRGPAPPGAVRAAGVVWAVIGVVGVVQGLAHLFVNVVSVAGRESPFGHKNVVGCCLGHLFAAGVLGLGLWVASGRAGRSVVLAGAISSIVFGMACGCLGFASYSLSRHIAAHERGAVYLVAALDALQGLALLAAAGLALAGYRAYADWQRDHI